MPALLPLLVLVVGCGDGGSGGDDDDDDDQIGPVECEAGIEPLEMGRCETDTGSDCNGGCETGEACRCEEQDGEECFGSKAELECGTIEHTCSCGGRECAHDADTDGALTEIGHFAPATDEMTLVVGPQGYTMFVFALRASGINPGATRAELPAVEVIVVDRDGGGNEVTYREYIRFVADGGKPGRFVTDEELWVVTATSVSFDLEGHSMSAIGTLTDHDGEERCGTVSFRARRQQ